MKYLERRGRCFKHVATQSSSQIRIYAHTRLLAPLGVLMPEIRIQKVRLDEHVRSIHLKSSCLLIQPTAMNNVSKTEPSEHISYDIAFKSSEWGSVMCDIIKFHPS